MPTVKDIKNVFTTKIQALYDIELQLVKALPKMEKAATNPDLKEGFRAHLAETKEHVRRLEQIFKTLEEKPKKLKSEGIRGIIADGEWVIKSVNADPALKDAMIAGAARYVEHYEMAGYLDAIGQASILGLTDVTVILTTTLNEEMIADEDLADAIALSLDTA